MSAGTNNARRSLVPRWMSTRTARVTAFEPRGTNRWLLGMAVLVLGFVVHLARRPGVFAHPILFAEDGPVFFLANRRHGIAAINDAYAGYLVMGPRTLAFVASLLPLSWTPIAYTLLAAAAAVVSCALVLNPRTSWLLGPWPVRVVIFFALLMLPQVAETHATLTNVMWWGGIGLLLVGIADDPDTRLGRIAELVYVVCVLFSGPIGIVFAPVIAWRWWRTRSRWTFAVGTVWALSCAVQVLILRGQHRNVGKVVWSRELAGVGVRRWFGPFTMGSDYVQSHLAPPAHWSRLAWWVTLLFAVLIVALATQARDRGAALVLLLLGALHVVAGFVAMGPLAHLLPDRYTVGAGAALILAVAGARPTRGSFRVVQLVLVVWALVLWPRNVAVPQRSGPSFAPAASCLDAHAATCHVPVYPEPFSFDTPG